MLTLFWVVVILVCTILGIVFITVALLLGAILHVYNFFEKHYGQWQSWATVRSATHLPKPILIIITRTMVRENVLHRRKDHLAVNDFLKELKQAAEKVQESVDDIRSSIDDESVLSLVEQVEASVTDQRDQLHANFAGQDIDDPEFYWLCEYRMIHSGRRRKKHWFRFALPWEQDLSPAY